MRRRRITTSKRKHLSSMIKPFPFSAYLLKLWLFEPLYLPPLRGTFLQRKA